jgi:RHS repeat-associated protein
MKGRTLPNLKLRRPKKYVISRVGPFLMICLIMAFLALVTLMTSRAAAQIRYGGTTPAGFAPGAPAGSYALSGLENINLFNGNLNFTLPLAKLGGRGDAQSTIVLPIESQWTNWYFFRYPSGDYMNPVPMYNFSPTVGFLSPRYGRGALMLRSEDVLIDTCSWGGSLVTYIRELRENRYRLTFTTPEGTEIELRDTVYGGAPVTYGHGSDPDSGSGSPPACDVGPLPSRGRTFVTADGTAATFISDAEIQVSHGPLISGPVTSANLFGYLKMRNGTQYRIDNGLVSWMRDHNGNQTTYTYTNNRVTLIKDSLGRETAIEYEVNDVAPYGLCDRITFKGTDGQTRTIRVSYSLLGQTLATGFSLQTKNQLFPHPSPDQVNEAMNTVNFDRNVISSVWLPDDSRYRFFYNSYAELARAELPTGGAYEYDWESGFSFGCNPLFQEGEILRRVKERRVKNDSTLEQKTTYSYTGMSCDQSQNTLVTVDHFNPSDQRINREQHSFYGSPAPPPYRVDLFNESPWTHGKEYRTDIYDADGTTLLRRVTQTWRQRAPVTWWVGPNLTQANAPANDPRVVETVTTLADTNQVSKVTSIDPADPSGETVGFDQFHNQTDVWEYDFGTGAPGQFLRRSHTDYVTNTNYTSETGAHLRGLPLQTWVSSDTNGNTKASLTQFEYDNYATDSNHAGLVSRSSVTGHDSTNYGIGFAYRGNVTAVTSYSNAAAQTGAVTTYSQYDMLGNVVKTIDPNGNAATVSYVDNFGSPDGEARTNTAPSQLNGQNTYAFATSSTNALGWVTGYSQVDYFTGAVVNTEDLNGVVSKTLYNDPLDRPTQTFSAIGTAFERQSNIVYDDVNRRVEAKSDLNTLNDNLIKSESFYDGLGRTFESRSYKDGGYVVSKSEFDALGRVKRATNPHRPHLNEQALWTESFYDALGRVTKVKTPDNAEALTSYLGSTVTATDQAGKQRRNITNALGQLIRVDEPDNNGNLTQPTYYYYNTLGSMVRVNQGVQNRYFLYDSLGRLLRVRQPEQTVNTALNTSGNPDNNSWTAAFTYDNNGNVLTTTDAKDTTVTNIYDTLNRPLTRTYEDGTPTANFYYDGAGLPSVPDNSRGNLTKATNSISESRYIEFDVLGRTKQYQQITDGQTYTSSYLYNFAGALVQETYPSGRTVQNSFDADGELSRIYGKATSTATERTFANAFTYTADGRIEKLRLGNLLWEAAKFNNRQQVTEFSLGHGVASADVWKNSYEYGELQTNGTVDATKNSGNIGKQTVTFNGLANPFVQTYKYDPLYRLTEAKETNNGNQTWKQVFDYDRYGNRTTHDKWLGTTAQTLTAVEEPTIDNTTNRLSSGQGYTFDANGNMTVDAEGRQFTFNGDNKQTEIKDDQDVTVGEYFYDGEGKRIKKITATETTVFVYSGSKLIAEYSTATPPQNPTTSYTVTDQLGSPRVIVNALGAVVSRRDFMPFGEEIDPDGTYRTTAQKYGVADSVRQKFTGYQKDEETGLDFAEARMYQNLHGRFTAIDPLLASGKSGNPQTFNRYVYVLNNPLIFTDPTGLQIGGTPMIPGGRWYTPIIPDGSIRYRFESSQPEGYLPVTERNHRGELIGEFDQGLVGDQRYYVLKFNEAGPMKAMPMMDVRTGQTFREKLTDYERNGWEVIRGPDFKWTGAVQDVSLDLVLTFQGAGGLGRNVFAGESVTALRFSQRSAGTRFGIGEGNPFRGMSVADVSDDVASRVLSPNDLPIGFVHRDGTDLIMNTRSTVALQDAGIPMRRWIFVNQTGEAAAEHELTRRLVHNNLRTQGTSTVRFGDRLINLP